MEVETQTLSTFDLKSKSPFSYGINLPIDSSDLHSQECRSYDMELNGPKSDDGGGLDSPVSQASEVESPAVGGRKCEEFDISGEPAVDGGLLELKLPASSRLESSYAVKLQKMYRGHRTRRRLADSAVVAEELWWQALDYARLNHSTISFFNFQKPETVASRWNRITLNASKVGKGLSKDAQAQKLAFQHWIEAIDPRHRYGHSLHLYYEEWVKADAGQPFFYWLDIGDGKEIDLKACPRSKLRQQCIKYLGPQERENYEYIVFEGRIVHKQTGSLLDTNKGPQGAKWIFVMSTFKKLYAGEKKKGVFHHSSFLAGGATLAAGRLVAEHGVLTSISAYSGHYRPTYDRLHSLLTFLSSNGVNLNQVQIHKANEDYDNYADSKSDVGGSTVEVPTKSDVPREEEKSLLSEPAKETQTATRSEYKRTLSGGLQSPRAEVPKKAILERINSKKAASSYQLGNQLTLKWSTGFGPRIGCVADYPLEVRQQALEFVNLSPRFPPTPSSCRRIAGLASPTAHLAPDFSNGDVTSGI